MYLWVYLFINVCHAAWPNEKQGNLGDMRKIHVTRQFFEASGRHGDLIEKTKNPFLDKINGSMCAQFQVCIVFRLARRRDKKQINKQTNKYIHTYASEFKNILDRLLGSHGFWLFNFILPKILISGIFILYHQHLLRFMTIIKITHQQSYFFIGK